jgi:hypothetical protein
VILGYVRARGMGDVTCQAGVWSYLRVSAPEDVRKRIARTFNVDTRAAPSSLLARARRAASENGATPVGDERSGRFSHELVKGGYRMVGQTVVVTITDKHWLLPWPVVEVRLRQFLASA